MSTLLASNASMVRKKPVARKAKRKGIPINVWVQRQLKEALETSAGKERRSLTAEVTNLGDDRWLIECSTCGVNTIMRPNLDKPIRCSCGKVWNSAVASVSGDGWRSADKFRQ